MPAAPVGVVVRACGMRWMRWMCAARSVVAPHLARRIARGADAAWDEADVATVRAAVYDRRIHTHTKHATEVTEMIMKWQIYLRTMPQWHRVTPIPSLDPTAKLGGAPTPAGPCRLRRGTWRARFWRLSNRHKAHTRGPSSSPGSCAAAHCRTTGPTLARP